MGPGTPEKLLKSKIIRTSLENYFLFQGFVFIHKTSKQLFFSIFTLGILTLWASMQVHRG